MKIGGKVPDAPEEGGDDLEKVVDIENLEDVQRNSGVSRKGGLGALDSSGDSGKP